MSKTNSFRAQLNSCPAKNNIKTNLVYETNFGCSLPKESAAATLISSAHNSWHRCQCVPLDIGHGWLNCFMQIRIDRRNSNTLDETRNQWKAPDDQTSSYSSSLSLPLLSVILSSSFSSSHSYSNFSCSFYPPLHFPPLSSFQRLFCSSYLSIFSSIHPSTDPHPITVSPSHCPSLPSPSPLIPFFFSLLLYPSSSQSLSLTLHHSLKLLQLLRLSSFISSSSISASSSSSSAWLSSSFSCFFYSFACFSFSSTFSSCFSSSYSFFFSSLSCSLSTRYFCPLLRLSIMQPLLQLIIFARLLLDTRCTTHLAFLCIRRLLPLNLEEMLRESDLAGIDDGPSSLIGVGPLSPRLINTRRRLRSSTVYLPKDDRRPIICRCTNDDDNDSYDDYNDVDDVNSIDANNYTWKSSIHWLDANDNNIAFNSVRWNTQQKKPFQVKEEKNWKRITK